jgi:hypothetical protein
MKSKFFLFALFCKLSIQSFSNVAFTSNSQLSKTPVHVIKNEIIKNENPNENTIECKYFRAYEAKYKFESNTHNHIYYFIDQCLDDSFEEIWSKTQFNYDGLNEKHNLPEGCVPPQVQEPPNNPCEHGFELGEELIKHISTIVAQQIFDHPEDTNLIETGDQPIDMNQFDQVKKKLPELEKLLMENLRINNDDNPHSNESSAKINNEDGTVTEIFYLANNSTGERTYKPEGNIETIIYQSNGNVVWRNDTPDGLGEIIYYDPEGNPYLFKSVEAIIGKPDYEKITTYDYNEKQLGVPIERLRLHNKTPLDVYISSNQLKMFDEVSKNFSEIIANFVTEKVKCFSENVINLEENYLTFVCSTQGHTSIKDVIKQKFGERVICGKHLDCDAIQEELLDRMLTDINLGGDGVGVQVVSDNIGTTLNRA